jgi:uncharacterized protein (DUF2237 family)
MAKNIFGEELMTCSENPLTGYFRDGCCRTDEHDLGSHTVCAVVTEDFLQFSLMRGNDLITPRPEYRFPGLKPGDRWCLCASRWLEAYNFGVAPMVILEATHEKTLEFVPLQELIKFAFKGVNQK